MILWFSIHVKYPFRRGEGGEERLGGPLWSPAAPPKGCGLDTIHYPNGCISQKMAKKSIENQPESTESAQNIEVLPLAIAGIVEQDQAPELILEASPEQPLISERRHIAKSATLVMLGNLGSSIMGMVRQIVVAALGVNIAG